MDIVWIDHPASGDVVLVGGKTANLSRLAAAHRVPPGFCLTTRAYTRAAGAYQGDEPHLQRSLPPDLWTAVAEAYDLLATRCGITEPRVAVRSSAPYEDGPAASFAGQHDTYLNITGMDAMAAAIGRCWVSARSTRALDYRRQHGVPADDRGIAVLVQQFVPADTSAVVFSANPISHRRDQVMITASWGLGESIVGGTVTPDTYVIGKDDLRIVDRRIAEKCRMTVSVPGGTREVDVPRLLRGQPALRDEQILEMTRLALALEDRMGWPVDLECAYHEGELYLLQCRPITTLADASSGAQPGQARPRAVI